jgi:hypothetical protein
MPKASAFARALFLLRGARPGGRRFILEIFHRGAANSGSLAANRAMAIPAGEGDGPDFALRQWA